MNWLNNNEMRLVIDNGSHQIRGTTCGQNSQTVAYYNMMATLKKGSSNVNIAGEDIGKIYDELEYRYIKPHVRGILVNFDSEIEIWNKMFEKFFPDKNHKHCSITMSIPPMLPNKVKEKLQELLFELYGFNAVCLMNSAQAINSLIKNKSINQGIPRNNSPINLMVESGHSCTYILPMFDGEVIKSGIRRLDVGGKLLTKQLSQMLSVRQFKMDGYFQTVNKIKEQVCYIENDVQYVLDNQQRKKLYYVLPDPDIKKQGYVLTDPTGTEHLQKVILTKERFQVPNVIFEPKSVGLDQGGITETIFESINSLHPDFYGHLVQNIHQYGGNTLFDGFYQKFHNEIRRNTDQQCNIGVNHLTSPNSVLDGMVQFTLGETFYDLAFNKQMYNEKGGQFLSTLI